MIRKKDGTPYQLRGKFGLYQPGGAIHDLFNKWDQQAIRWGGSPILYYKLLPTQKVDPLYKEIRDKLWSPEGIEMCALWEPPQPLQNLDQFGIDGPNDTTFIFNREEFVRRVGELPQTGALIRTVVDDMAQWEIIQVNTNIIADLDRMVWGKYRLAVMARKYQPSATEHDPGKQGWATNQAPTIDPKRSFPIR